MYATPVPESQQINSTVIDDTKDVYAFMRSSAVGIATVSAVILMAGLVVVAILVIIGVCWWR